MSRQAAVRFSTSSLCERLPGSSPALSAMWFALQIAKLKKYLVLRAAGFREGGKYRIRRTGGWISRRMVLFLCIKAGFAGREDE